MPTYTYTGAYPRAFFGLSVGVNATVNRDPGKAPLVDGQTVVLEPGNTLITTEPYPHAELTETEPAEPQPPQPGEEVPAPEPPAEAPANTEPATPETPADQPADVKE